MITLFLLSVDLAFIDSGHLTLLLVIVAITGVLLLPYFLQKDLKYNLGFFETYKEMFKRGGG